MSHRVSGDTQCVKGRIINIMSLTETNSTTIPMEHCLITIVTMLLFISVIEYSPTYSAPANGEFLSRHMASRNDLLARERERMIGGKIQLTTKEQKVRLSWLSSRCHKIDETITVFHRNIFICQSGG